MSWILANCRSPAVAVAAVLGLGLLFLSIAYLSGLHDSEIDGHIAYFRNVSWSITMLVLFPPAFGLMARFYQNVPGLLDELARSFGLDAKQLQDEVHSRLNRHYITALYLLVLPLWYLYFDGLKDSQTWIWEDFTPPKTIGIEVLSRITVLGYVTTAAHVILGSSFIFLVRVAVFGHALHKHLASTGCRLSPFHQDGRYGLGGVRRQLQIALGVLWLFGAYIVVYLLDKIFIQHVQTSSWPILAFYVISFVVIALSYYRWILAPFHGLMLQAKHDALKPLSDFLAQNNAEDHLDISGSEALNYAEVHQRYLNLLPRLPEWLIEFRSWPVVFVQIVPIAISIGLEMFSRFNNSG